MLGHFCLQNLVHGFLQEHLDPTIAEQNLTEGLPVESNLNLGRRPRPPAALHNLLDTAGPSWSEPLPGLNRPGGHRVKLHREGN